MMATFKFFSAFQDVKKMPMAAPQEAEAYFSERDSLSTRVDKISAQRPTRNLRYFIEPQVNSNLGFKFQRAWVRTL